LLKVAKSASYPDIENNFNGLRSLFNSRIDMNHRGTVTSSFAYQADRDGRKQ